MSARSNPANKPDATVSRNTDASSVTKPASSGASFTIWSGHARTRSRRGEPRAVRSATTRRRLTCVNVHANSAKTSLDVIASGVPGGDRSQADAANVRLFGHAEVD